MADLTVSSGTHTVNGTETYEIVTVEGTGKIVVPAGTILEITGNANLGGNNVEVSGSLHASGVALNVTAGTFLAKNGADLEFLRMQINGGNFHIGESGTPILDATPVNVTIDDNGQIMAINGEFNVYGRTAAQKTPLCWLQNTIREGTTTIQVKDASGADPVGWNVGDKIAIASSTYYAYESEEHEIADIDGDTITLVGEIVYDHFGGNPFTVGPAGGEKDVPARAEVINLTRSVKVGNNSDLTRRDLGSGEVGAHIMIMPSGTAQVEGLEMYQLGIVQPSEFDSSDGGKRPSPSGKGIGRRYPFHWHRAGDKTGDYLKNCVVNKGRNQGIVTHSTSNVLIEDCACWKTWSHNFTIGEDGDETGNVYRRCIAMYGRRVYNVADVSPTGDNSDFPASFILQDGDMEDGRISGGNVNSLIAPGLFWSTTTDFTMEDCIAAGGIAMQGLLLDANMMRPGVDDETTLDRPDSSTATQGPTFIGTGSNPALLIHSLLPEGTQSFGVNGDVEQGTCFFNKFFTLVYRSSAWGVFVDDFASTFDIEISKIRGYALGNGLVWGESTKLKVLRLCGFPPWRWRLYSRRPV